jgi:hypothetical protein
MFNLLPLINTVAPPSPGLEKDAAENEVPPNNILTT